MEVETATETVATPTAPQETAPATVTPEVGQATAEDSFFDVTALAPELMPAYKQMQAAYTKKTQAIAANRRKLEEYDRFMSDPRNNLVALARQYGVDLGQPPAKETLDNWQPQTWQEVMDKAKEEARNEVMKDLAPHLNPLYEEFSQLKRSHTEKLLDDNVPEWRQYEDGMTDLLTKHPTLANDPVTLAELAIPKEVRESKAMQAALKKLQSKASATEVSGASNTKASEQPAPTGRPTFAQAVELAKARLRGKP